MAKLVFPQDFLWGSSTAAHQVEGNNTNSDWWQWEHASARAAALKKQNKNPEEFYSGIACDSYNRYEADFDLLTQLNQNAHRLSIEWARVQPEEGGFDQNEIGHYRKVLQALERRGITPIVTLHHFTSPIWFMDKGGWARVQNLTYFLRYAEKIIAELGELIDYVCVINEPNIYANHSYLHGNWPPQKHNPAKAHAVLKNMHDAHCAVYTYIKEALPRIQVGTALNVQFIEARGMLKPLQNFLQKQSYGNMLASLARRSDFIGINYYSRKILKFSAKYPFFKPMPAEHKPLSDFGWEIYPQGLYELLMQFSEYRKPIFITENGIADAGDKMRSQFIFGHLKAVYQAIAKGAPVKAYLHWSLLDNFEWAQGYGMKFGLVAVDRAKNLERKVRPSALYYAEICKNNYMEDIQ